MVKITAVEKGKINKQRYADYVSNLELTGKKFPTNSAGTVNLSIIATACGFNRQVFFTNKSMKEQLDLDVARLGKAVESSRENSKSTTRPDEGFNTEKLFKTIELKDMEISALKKQISILQKLLAENENKMVESNNIFDEILLSGRRFTL